MRIQRDPTCRRQPASQRGFTMVEVLVAMVILAIVLLAAYTVVTNIFSATGTATSNRKTEHLADRALDQVTDDLRAARASDRAIDKLPDLRALQQGLMAGTPIPDLRNPDPNAPPLDVQDIKAAGPQQLTFLEDVVLEDPPVAECVSYRYQSSTTQWWVSRDVDRYNRASQSCPPPGMGRSGYLVPREDANYLAAPAAIFGYEMTCSTRFARCSRAQAAAGARGAGDCRSFEWPAATAVPTQYLAFITSIHLNIVTSATRGGAESGNRREATNVGIRSRQNHDYLYALGCET